MPFYTLCLLSTYPTVCGILEMKCITFSVRLRIGVV